MAPWGKILVTKSDDLHLIPRTHVVGELTSSYKLSSDLHIGFKVCLRSCAYNTHIHTHNK